MSRRVVPGEQGLPRERVAVLQLGADPSVLEVDATITGETQVIRDVTSLRMFVSEQAAAITPSQSRALGVLHVLLAATELGSVDATTLRPVVDAYRPPFEDPVWSDAFTAGEETALFDLRRVPPAPLVAALRTASGGGAVTSTHQPHDNVTPLPTPEIVVGRRLDENHPARVQEPMSACVVCGFGTDDSFERALRHYPLPEELPRVAAWFAAYGPRSGS